MTAQAAFLAAELLFRQSTPSLGVSARLDVRKAERSFKRVQAAMEKAQRQALNRTLDRGHTRTVRALSQKLGVARKHLTRAGGKRGRVRKYPMAQGRRSKSGAVLWIGTNARLGYRALGRKLLTAEPAILKTYGTHPDQPRFLAVANGARNVFARRGRSRLPIDKVVILYDEDARRAGDEHMTRQYREFFPREVDRILSRTLKLEV